MRVQQRQKYKKRHIFGVGGKKLDGLGNVTIILRFRSLSWGWLAEKRVVAWIAGAVCNVVSPCRATHLFGTGHTGIPRVVRQKIILTPPLDGVVVAFKVFEEVGFVVVQKGPQGTVAADVGGPTGSESDSRLGADGVRDVGLVEPRAFLSKLVKIGCLNEWVSVATERLGSHFVRLKEDEVVGSWFCVRGSV